MHRLEQAPDWSPPVHPLTRSQRRSLGRLAIVPGRVWSVFVWQEVAAQPGQQDRSREQIEG
jgi:hypothetical protein